MERSPPSATAPSSRSRDWQRCQAVRRPSCSSRTSGGRGRASRPCSFQIRSLNPRMRFLGLDGCNRRAARKVDMNLRATPDCQNTGLTDRNGRVTIPGTRAIDGSALGGIHPPLQFDVVRLTETLHEAGCDGTAPAAVGGLDLQILVQADESTALLTNDLGPHLVRHAGSDE